jgi:hypothetical protein
MNEAWHVWPGSNNFMVHHPMPSSGAGGGTEKRFYKPDQNIHLLTCSATLSRGRDARVLKISSAQTYIKRGSISQTKHTSDHFLNVLSNLLTRKRCKGLERGSISQTRTDIRSSS